MSLQDQAHYIINAVVTDLLKFFETCFDQLSCESVYFVVDPTETPKYIINTDMCAETYTNIICPDGNFLFEAKKEEQDNRQSQRNNRNLLESEFQFIENRADIPEDYIYIMKEIYEQSYYFVNPNNKMKLSNFVLSYIEDARIQIIDAKCEADLVIKNVASLNSEEITLIWSRDLDYYVLFADMENVYITESFDCVEIYNPHKCWVSALGKDITYDYIIRLAPLFGNDYTAKQKILSADKIDDIKMLITSNFDNLKCNKRKTIGKCSSVVNWDWDYSTDSIDAMIYRFDPDYFRKYYISVLIYKNWFVYDGCSVREHVADKFELYKSWSDNFDFFYIWDSSYLFRDNIKFISESNIMLKTMPVVNIGDPDADAVFK